MKNCPIVNFHLLKKKHKEVVLKAVENHGESFEFASPELQKDKEIALCSLKNDG